MSFFKWCVWYSGAHLKHAWSFYDWQAGSCDWTSRHRAGSNKACCWGFLVCGRCGLPKAVNFFRAVQSHEKAFPECSRVHDEIALLQRKLCHKLEIKVGVESLRQEFRQLDFDLAQGLIRTDSRTQNCLVMFVLKPHHSSIFSWNLEEHRLYHQQQCEEQSFLLSHLV